MKIENTAELRLLIECAQGGSLSAASRVLDITPAAASAMLKKMEARLGLRLVERSTRALRLTPAGEQLRDYGRRALALLDEGLDAISELGAARPAAGSSAVAPLRGRIRLSASSDLSRRVLLPLLQPFLQQHPALELHLSVSDSLRDLVREEVDLALRYGELADSGLVARPLWQGRRVLVAAPSYLLAHGAPLHPEELVRHQALSFTMRNRHERVWRLWPVADLQGPPLALRVAGRLSCDDGEIAHRWALAGLGIACKSELDVRDSLASGALVRLLPGWVSDPIPLHALMPSGRFLPQRVRALVDHLAQQLAQSSPSAPS